MADKSIKLARLPGTNRVGIYWDAPPPNADPTENHVEPSHFSVPNDDPSGPAELHFAVADLGVEEIKGEDVRGFTRKVWKKNGGHPPGRVFLRPPDGSSTLEERLDVRMPDFEPSPTLKRRARAAAKAGGTAEKRMIDAETEEERLEFQEWLEDRKRRGPG